MDPGLSIVQIVDGVIAFTLLEGLALVLYNRGTGKGVGARDFLANMISGLCLMLALRCLANDAGAGWTALCLLAAGVAHGTDVWMRWRHTAGPANPARRSIA